MQKEFIRELRTFSKTLWAESSHLTYVERTHLKISHSHAKRIDRVKVDYKLMCNFAKCCTWLPLNETDHLIVSTAVGFFFMSLWSGRKSSWCHHRAVVNQFYLEVCELLWNIRLFRCLPNINMSAFISTSLSTDDSLPPGSQCHQLLPACLCVSVLC